MEVEKINLYLIVGPTDQGQDMFIFCLVRSSSPKILVVWGR